MGKTRPAAGDGAALTRIFHAFEMFIGKAAGVPLYGCTAST
jgi:hypothetical protein